MGFKRLILSAWLAGSIALLVVSLEERQIFDVGFKYNNGFGAEE